MALTKTHKIILSIVAVLVLLAIYIAFDKRKENEISLEVKTDQNVSTTTSSSGQISVGGDGEYTIEQVPIGEGNSLPQPIPNLERPATLSAGAVIAPEAKVLAVEKIKEMQSTLKKDPANVMAWIYLGTYQKQAGDYEGAVISWKYAGRLSPTDFISLANLGNLYAYFIKDNGQAEVYYKKAITNAPTIAYVYVQLAEVYRDVFKDLDKARAIVNQGLTKIPNDSNLLKLKASLN